MINKNIVLRNIKLALPFLIGITLLSCIKEFNPTITDSEELLVINGSLIKGDSIQIVTISKSKSVYDTSYNAITGCKVWVENEQGIQFPYSETTTGIYKAEIADAYLIYNTKFKLRVTTPNGEEYESEYETIFESVPIDEIYHINEPYQTSSEQHDEGLQYYIDLKAEEGASKNYRWKLEETWEYHSKYAIDGYFFRADSTIINIERDYRLYYCWNTVLVNSIYTSTTNNLTINEKKKIPLVYVPGTSTKLNHHYSLLVKQYALSDNAYEYWDRNRIETTESGGLYQAQPSQSRSNIYNLDNQDEVVLGFFWASSFTQKRIFYNDGPLVSYSTSHICIADTLDLGDPFASFNRERYYLTLISQTPIATYWGRTDKSCFDCTLKGGETTKPDFMP